VAAASRAGGGFVWEQKAGGVRERGWGSDWTRRGPVERGCWHRVGQRRGRAGNGDSGGALIALLWRLGGAGEEWAPVGDGQAGRQREWECAREGRWLSTGQTAVVRTAGGLEGRTVAVGRRRGWRQAFQWRPSAGAG
jgi:hypothetical protein